MINYHPAKFGGHRHCGSEVIIMILVVEMQDSTCLYFYPPLLFFTKANSMPCSHTRNFRSLTKSFASVFHEGLLISVTHVHKNNWWKLLIKLLSVVSSPSKNSTRREEKKKMELQSFLRYTQMLKTCSFQLQYVCLSMYEITPISWWGNFLQTYSLPRASGKSTETSEKLRVSTKFPHQKIR